MPGYGILGPAEGTGLLPWSWAVERLTASHDYWMATVWPDGRPHVMPVWGVWLDDALWFSSSRASRKARNLDGSGACVVTTDDPNEPVVLDGQGARVTRNAQIAAYAQAADAKYETAAGVDFYGDPANGVYRVEPVSVFGLDHDDFSGSPTRWTFDAKEGGARAG